MLFLLVRGYTSPDCFYVTAINRYQNQIRDATYFAVGILMELRSVPTHLNLNCKISNEHQVVLLPTEIY